MLRNHSLLDLVLKNRVATHALFWISAWLIAPITSAENVSDLQASMIYRGVGLPVKMLATYLLIYYQLPKLFRLRRYGPFILSLLGSILVFCLIYRINNVQIAERLAGSEGVREPISQILVEWQFAILTYLPRVYGFSIPFLMIKIVKDRELKIRQVEQLSKEKAKAELSFLKAQIHPHFLFNTLNNLYALTLDKSDEAPNVVAKLAEMLDYMLYQCKEDRVLLTKEIELLRHYIDLEKIRYGSRLKVEFSSEIDDEHAVVAPLILISIVENAFKHGVSGSTVEAEVRVNIEYAESHLHFEVYNTKSPISGSDPGKYRDGIGVKNIERQLDLIYPEKYAWAVDENEDYYSVKLDIVT